MGIVLTCGSLFFDVPERGRHRKTAMKRTEWMACIVIGAMIIYAVWNTAAVRYQLIKAEEYRVALTQQTERLALENERLEREIACAEEPAVIERVARTQLGLVKPGEIIFRVIQPETRERE